MGRVVRRSRRSDLVCSRLGDGVERGAERVEDLLRRGPVIEVFDAMLDAGQFAGAVARGGGADLVLGPTHEPVPRAGDATVERGDRTGRDVRARDPRHREREVCRDTTSHRGQQHAVEAGAVQRPLGHEARAVDRARVAREHVVAGVGATVYFAERGELGDGVGIVGWVGAHRRVLPLHRTGEVEERAGAERDDAAHPVRSGGIEDVDRPVEVHGVEVVDVLAGAAEQRRAVDGRVAALRGVHDVVGPRDVALHQLDTDGRERRGFVGVAHERPHRVASLDQLFADVGAGEPRAAGDEDGRHGGNTFTEFCIRQASRRFTVSAVSIEPADVVSMLPRSTSVDAILAGTRRVIAERGPGKFTMSAVAAAAGVSRKTLYRWFPTKGALLDALTTYEEPVFDAQLHAVVDAQRTPARRLDAALRLLVTYLDELMGPDPVGADPGFAIQSLARSLAPQTASFVRLLGDAFETVPAVRLGRLRREQAAELFLRVAYSHYVVPHADAEVLLANLRSFAGLSRTSITRAAG